MNRRNILLGIVLCLVYLNLYAQTTTVNGKIRGIPNAPSSDTFGCCIPGSIIDTPRCDIRVKLTNLTNGSTKLSSITGTNGLYSITAVDTGRHVKLECDQTDTKNYTNGVSTFDIVTINKHFLKIKRLNCPLKRIASDVTNNGVIDTIDLDSIRTVILGIRPGWPAPNWRYIPRAYVDPTRAILDPEFYKAFWTTAYADQNNKEYPFNAIKTYKNNNGIIRKYNYLGGSGLNGKWIDTLNEMYLTNTNGSNAVLWDFYTVKTGDVGNGANLCNFCGGGGSSLKGNQFVFRSLTNLASRNVKNYKLIKIRIKTEKPVIAFQFAINADQLQLKWKKDSIYTNKFIRKFVESQNLGATDIEKGIIKVSWDSRELTPLVLDGKEDILVLNIAQQKVDLNINTAAIIDQALMNIEFITEDESLVVPQFEFIYE